MKTETTTQVQFSDDNRNFVRVTGAKTMDEAVTAADEFLEEYGMAVKNGGQWYGDNTEAEEVVTFNV